jgi:flavin reductase (DIM6/NTAB) family NADH-FMN oxidoreductase RutF
MICDRAETLAVGSHDVLIGEVRAVRVGSEISTPLYEDGKLVRSLCLD